MDVSNILYIKLWMILRKKILKLVTDHLFQVQRYVSCNKESFHVVDVGTKVVGIFQRIRKRGPIPIGMAPGHLYTLIHVFKVSTIVYLARDFILGNILIKDFLEQGGLGTWPVY